MDFCFYKDQIWIASLYGLIVYDKKRHTFKDLKTKIPGSSYSFQIIKNSQGRIILSSASGVYDVDPNDYSFFLSSHESCQIKSLISNAVKSVYEDRNQNLWVGTLSGLSVHYNRKNFNTCSYISGIPNSLSHNLVRSIVQLSDGDYMIGYTEGHIDILNSNLERKKTFLKSSGAQKGETVFSLYQDAKGVIWVGSYKGEIQIFDKKNNRFYPFKLPSNKLKWQVKDVRSICEDNEQNMWLLSHGEGIVKLNKNRTKAEFFNKANAGLSDDYGNCIKCDNTGNLWVASPCGISVLKKGEKKFHNYVHNKNDSLSISKGNCIYLFIDKWQQVWVATDGGLNLLNKEKNTFTRFTTQDGLLSNSLSAILDDEFGNLWISSKNGLSRFDYNAFREKGRVKNLFRNYNYSDGLQDNEFTECTAFKSKSGELFFGGSEGLNHFYAKDIKDNQLVPKVLITDFKLFNNSVIVGQKGSPLKENISHVKEITLSYKQNVVTIGFTLLDFVNANKNQYAYKLEGFDTKWNYIGTRREVTYTNLDPKKYVFKVKGANSDGIWNEIPTELILNIKPMFYQLLWFKSLVAILLSLLLLLYIRGKMRTLQRQKRILQEKVALHTKALVEANNYLNNSKMEIYKQNQELEEHRNRLEHLVEERTKDLLLAKEKAEESDRLKSAFLANMSHEIRTPMNAIVGFSRLLTEDTTSDDEKTLLIDYISKNVDTLLRLINDIVDISLIEAGQITVHPVVFDLNLLVDDTFRNFRNKALNLDKKLEVFYDDKDAEEDLFVCNDVVRLKQVLNNLIENAVKYTNEGYVKFGYTNRGNEILFYVEDTGIGLKDRDKEKVFDRFYKVEENPEVIYRGTGLGLSICKQLVEKMGGKIWVSSTLGIGSVFYFTVGNDLEKVKEYMAQKPPKTSKTAVWNDIDWISKKILVVEDESSNYIYIKKILPQKAVVYWAKNGCEALNEVSSGAKFDLILMDIKMPEMDGYTAVEEIRKIDATVPILFQTAYAMQEEIAKINASKANGYITKPYSKGELMTVISKLIKESNG
jgi:signal transduction histidine kinase/CheY-like chemotaxis protein